MKFNKLMFAALALGALAMVSCKKKDEPVDPITPPTPQPSVELPDVQPTEGAVTIVVKFDVAPCPDYDIRFVGSHAENAWDLASAPAMEAIGDGWYKYVAKPNEEGTIAGRPIQGTDEDIEWSYDWSHNPEEIIDLKGVEDGMKATNEYGETNLNFTEANVADAVVVFFECQKWNKKPCAEAAEYNVTVIVPDFCEEFAIELVGSFEGWGTTPVALTKVEGNKFNAKFTAFEGDAWKVRGEGGWDKEIQVYRTEDDPATTDFDEADTWGGVPNNVLTDEKNVTVDYSDPAKYRWNVCAEDE